MRQPGVMPGTLLMTTTNTGDPTMGIAMESTSNVLKYWICRITDSDGIIHKGFSVQSAKIAFYRADHNCRVALPLLQRCASCGATANLTAGYAGGNVISYCPQHRAEEEMR